MGTYNSAVITTAGQALLARTLADNLQFYFTSAKTTEYVVPSGTSAASLTELPNIKQSEEITSATVSGSNQVTTSVRFDNTEITLDYSINTIGVYAKAGTDTEETLLAVITAITADVMPSYSAANPVAYVYSINLAISNASSINIVVSPTGTVNVAEFNELKERVDEIIDSGTGLSTDAKMALLNCFEHVAWIDENGQTYYDTLHDALFQTAVSISATFTPGSHVFYDTDSLDALRPYLVVMATTPDSTVEIVTDYVLTGSMQAGTNTITVRYQGLTDTFEVTTISNPAHITAVYTQPQAPIYTTDTLDSLKTDLVVTYYADAQSTGVVVPSTDYILSGTLTVGTSIVMVTYNDLTTTFTVTVTSRRNPDLPNTYEQVEYIKSSQSQYIVLDDILSAIPYKISATASYNTDGTHTGGYFVSTIGSSTQRYYAISFTNSKIASRIGNNSWLELGRIGDAVVDEVYHIDMDLSYTDGGNAVLSMEFENASGSVTLTAGSIDGVDGHALTLFALDATGGTRGLWTLYGLTIYSGQTKLFDGVPCYRKSDNKTGIFNTANNTFYPNATNTELIIGSIIQ